MNTGWPRATLLCAAVAAVTAFCGCVQTPSPTTAGRATPPAGEFGFADVEKIARDLAGRPYVSQRGAAGAYFSGLNYDEYNQINFNRERMLWRDRALPFELDFFHPGYRFPKTISVNEVVDGRASPLAFNRTFYTYGNLAIPSGAQNPEGYAGLRLHTQFDGAPGKAEFMVFLGASYFRAVARGQRYGQSARGIAINTGLPEPEEFPDFEAFWLVRPAPGDRTLTVFALLNGPSVTGAFQFDIAAGGQTVMDVTAAIFLRQPVKVFGVAPLTGMFWFGENSRTRPYDWRPKVHDCDGLLIGTAPGQWQWRALDVARYVRHDSFPAKDLLGFGLVQRDRRFTSYLDTWSEYEKRPTVMVLPRNDWGPGAVNLVEIPTDNENEDNIVAFWTPDKLPTATQPLRIKYRLRWGGESVEPPPPRSRVLATRQGQWYQHEETYFAVDFSGNGGPLPLPEARFSAGDGAEVSDVQIFPNAETDGWLVRFRAALKPGVKDAKLTGQLFRNGAAVSEQWNYLWSAPL